MNKPKVGVHTGETVSYLGSAEAVQKYRDSIVAEYDAWLMARTDDMHIISQVYCTKINENKELDSDLLMDIVIILKKHFEVA